MIFPGKVLSRVRMAHFSGHLSLLFTDSLREKAGSGTASAIPHTSAVLRTARGRPRPPDAPPLARGEPPLAQRPRPRPLGGLARGLPGSVAVGLGAAPPAPLGPSRLPPPAPPCTHGAPMASTASATAGPAATTWAPALGVSAAARSWALGWPARPTSPAAATCTGARRRRRTVPGPLWAAPAPTRRPTSGWAAQAPVREGPAWAGPGSAAAFRRSPVTLGSRRAGQGRAGGGPGLSRGQAERCPGPPFCWSAGEESPVEEHGLLRRCSSCGLRVPERAPQLLV